MAYETPYITDDPAKDAEVIQLRPGGEPESQAVPASPAAFTEPSAAKRRKDIIPPKLQRENIHGTVIEVVGVQGHWVLYHGVRLHWHAGRILWFALLGIRKLAVRLLVWWHWTHGWAMESQGVAAGRPGHNDAMSAHREGKKTRKSRGITIAVCAGLALVLALVIVLVVPSWGWWLLIAATIIVLAVIGKPAGAALLTSAVIPTAYEKPSPAIITRALGALGIKGINDAIAAGPLHFISDPHRDGPGWGVQLDLPYGVTPTMILARREQLASGLRRPLSATWPAAVPHEHAGRLELWIGFHDMSKVKAPVWPLAKSGESDVFAGFPFGTDPRGRNVAGPLFEVNWLIGAAPGQGKTATVRVIASAAALDVLADLWVHELAGKGDLDAYAQVCHRYTSGLDDESVRYTAQSLAMLRTELDRRSGAFKKLPKSDRPEGKVTRALAERRGLKLRPLVCIIDEAQNLFMHPDVGSKAAEDAAYVIRLGRAYGIVVVLATQRPDSQTMPTSISGIVSCRFCLKVPDQPANDMILGTGAYKAGYNSVIFRAKTDAGLGWLRADGDPQVVKTYYLDEIGAERIAKRARAMREAAGVLSGYALGESGDTPARSFAADVVSIMGTDARLWSETIATRLREGIPEAYAAITAEAVASQLRDLGVNVRDVREAGGVRKGAYRADVAAVAGLVGV